MWTFTWVVYFCITHNKIQLQNIRIKISFEHVIINDAYYYTIDQKQMTIVLFGNKTRKVK